MFCTLIPGNCMLTGRNAVPSICWKAFTLSGLSFEGSRPPASRTSGGSLTSSIGVVGVLVSEAAAAVCTATLRRLKA